jgi:glyoxylase-like metal-dependent hydrolase (beta-lactamase superfamily II)
VLVTIKRFVTAPIENNCYLISDGAGHCMLVDPGNNCGQILDALAANEQKLEAILLTHGHCDHIFGLDEVMRRYPQVPVFVHNDDTEMLRNVELNGSARYNQNYVYDGEVRILTDGPAEIGAFDFQVLHTPGHSPGSCCFLFDEQCFTGDTIFAGSIGRYDLPGGDAMQLLGSIRAKLLDLPDATQLHPGHGPDTTILHERTHNPMIRWA